MSTTTITVDEPSDGDTIELVGLTPEEVTEATKEHVVIDDIDAFVRWVMNCTPKDYP